MNPFHERLARVALDTAAGYGFCLAGGYAVQAHGFGERVSKDVDLFHHHGGDRGPPRGAAAVTAALRTDGLESTLELGVDWRAYPPVLLAIGLVLHPIDAVASKLCALFGRAAVRDYIDVYGVLTDGRFTGPALLQVAAEHDPGFDPVMFAEALRAVTRLPASAFEPYKLAADRKSTRHRQSVLGSCHGYPRASSMNQEPIAVP